MWIFLVAAIIYYFVLAADLKFKLQYQSYQSAHSQVCDGIGIMSVYKNAISIKDAFDRLYQKISGVEMEQQELPPLPA
ncbi:hypothetical protein Pint_32728 [Pistacia integerrima]|uniref:Uncharacterized protein n=3 Tax=Pistacia TaxID=55512 RepID=A0ACC1AF24_9ROSI|nr:hypothetical protein Pint_32715 [Pistacia integerrima]KAJ0021367.1 hypothetical protein Pint_32728 [Pistacia integerrima]KAJ0084953.1 hypothetical protein Patl1_31266 [Pistacia atlantica]